MPHDSCPLIDLSDALTTHSTTRMSSLTYIRLAHSVTNVAFALSLNSHLEKGTKRDGRLTAPFGL
jgi:hypothetical protein